MHGEKGRAKMFGIFMESFVIFKLYTGLRWLFALTLLFWIYLLIRERNKTVRMLFVYAPALIVLLFLFPLSRKFFVAAGLDGETYYRVLWTIPMGMIASYGACRLFARCRKVGLVVMTGLIVFCGSLVYKSPYISKAENLYHIPDAVVKVCDYVGNKDASQQVTALFPEEMIHYVRQYDATIKMPYGRDMLVERWDYYNEVHEVIKNNEVLPMKELLEATRKEYCQYLIFPQNQQMDMTPEKSGLILRTMIDGYCIYEDPVVTEIVTEWKNSYGI